MAHRINKCLVAILILVSSIMIPVSAAVSVKIFSKQEALTEVNISRPRIYIQNTGSESISNITYYYYLSVEDNKVPVPDLYYVNGHTVTIENMGNSLYRVSYTITGSIAPGQSFPDASGNTVGIHYNDWGNWDKTNDYSENNSPTFVENTKIAVYYNNIRIYGTEPVSGGDDGGNDSIVSPVPPLLTPQLLSFALFSTDSSIVKERSVFSGGGAVGSNIYTNIGIDAIIYGNVISGGNGVLMQKAKIYGDVKVSGVVTTELGVSVTGEIQQGVDVGTISLPSRSITPGEENITVGQNGTRTLAPGIYGELSVDRYGTITLSKGNYVFKKIYLETDAHIIFNTKFNEQTSIDVSGDVQFSDRSTVTFSDNSYSPSVQIYTNDSDEISIGTNVIMSGILVAPHAKVIVYSNAQCNGAIYAKTITLEPDSRVMSSMVDPNGDADGDSIPNYLEILMGTNPADPTSFKAAAIPDKSIINTVGEDATVKYKPGVFYDGYTEENRFGIHYPAGSLTDPYTPLIVEVQSPDSSNQIPVDQDYTIVGRLIHLSGNGISDNHEVEMSIPLPEGDQLPGMYKFASVSPSGLNIDDNSSSGGEGEMNVKIGNTGTYAIVKMTSKAVAYLDDGTVFSTLNAAKVVIDFAISGCKIDPENNGTAVLKCTELIGNGLTNEKDVTINLRNNGAGLIIGKGSLFSSARCTLIINTLSINIPEENFTRSNIIAPGVYKIKPGQCFNISTTKSIDALKNENANVPDRYVFSYSSNILVFESGSLNGEGVVRKYPNAPEPYKYNYFYKDHLGTTRMVMKDDNYLSEALMYQPYGACSDVSIIQQPSTEPLREKFTGKEFDEEGAVFSEFKFDIFISEFINVAGTIKSVYALFEDPVTNEAFIRKYNLTVENNGLRLGKKENFSRTMKLKEIKINAFGNGQIINYTRDIGKTVNTGEEIRVSLFETTTNLSNDIGQFIVSGPMEMEDKVTGSRLYYFGARYYDADVGIFTSTDPMGQFWDLYSYGCNPTNTIDPDGMELRPTGNNANTTTYLNQIEQVTGAVYVMDNGKMVENPGLISNYTGSVLAKQVVDMAIASQDVITINLVNDDPNVFIDAYVTSTMDVSDVAGFLSHSTRLGAEAIIHTINEQAYAVSNGFNISAGQGYNAAHNNALRIGANLLGGMTRTAIMNPGYQSGAALSIKFLDAGGTIKRSFNLTLNSNKTPR
ncbi:MAG: RHS repeat-associated core domain-containing protein [Fibrobacter sp.]|nr:RHS repeat-associated core domain-containing protein [Fibrobacter sp.]